MCVWVAQPSFIKFFDVIFCFEIKQTEEMNAGVFSAPSDLTEAVPETERLDSSLQKAKAQLSIKTRRHRPSRTRLRDSLSSIDGEDVIDRLVSVNFHFK